MCNNHIGVRVTDDGECFGESAVAPAPLMAESGRGLYIAKQLAADFRVTLQNGKCIVSAILS